jgi:hypothetical protein
MLATQNMSIQTSLGNISTSISRANELAFQEQEQEKNRLARTNKDAKEALDEIKKNREKDANVRFSMPKI